jgi:hypothetical protein
MLVAGAAVSVVVLYRLVLLGSKQGTGVCVSSKPNMLLHMSNILPACLPACLPTCLPASQPGSTCKGAQQ